MCATLFDQFYIKVKRMTVTLNTNESNMHLSNIAISYKRYYGEDSIVNTLSK